MPLKVVVGGVEKGAERASVIVNGAAKRATRIEAYNSSAWKLVQSFAPPISLTTSPSSLNASVNSASVAAVITENCTAFVTGGTGPYTYSWVQTSGPAASIYSPTSATTKFAMALGPGSSESAQFTCTVTDSNGLNAAATAFVTFSNISGA